ncbi:MAG: hypothetical protein L3V56_10330 [Candidatus Magnetoovum sp. WYHC-5]|nr:hypothetical protein [Candidatus Magnetoovum sp. WYHC-5]
MSKKTKLEIDLELAHKIHERSKLRPFIIIVLILFGVFSLLFYFKHQKQRAVELELNELYATYSKVKLELEFLKRECKNATGVQAKKDKNFPSSTVSINDNGGNGGAAANGTVKKAMTPPTKIIIR